MSVKCFSLHGVLYVCIKIRPQEAEKRHDKESNAYIQDNNIDPVLAGVIFAFMRLWIIAGLMGAAALGCLVGALNFRDHGDKNS